jgi:patatin-like phospholipase/acyl hydrolase
MKKILSIDGGGIKGVFPASFLATVEDTVGAKINDHFDLIVGTSTGGIIALGLGMGYSAKEMLSFYEELGPKIFKGNSLFRRLRQIGFAKYDTTPLKEALTSKFGDKRLGDSFNRLVIPSVNLETGEVHVYKTSHNKRFERDYKEKVVGVALATSAAPSYFPSHTSTTGIPLVDGGVWANNPMGLAVVEAIGVLGWDKDDIEILSIGCTSEPSNIKTARKQSRGLAYWGVKMIDLFMSTQSFASYGTALLLLGSKNVYRFSPVVSRGRFGLDSISEIGSLKGLGDSEARKALPSIRHFFSEKADLFIPEHKL